MLRCERLGCDAEARWVPVLALRAPYELRNSTPAPAILALGICDVHQQTTGLEDYLNDAGWAQIVHAFQAIKRAVPDRDRTILEWQPIDTPNRDVQMMVATIRRRQEKSHGV